MTDIVFTPAKWIQSLHKDGELQSGATPENMVVIYVCRNGRHLALMANLTVGSADYEIMQCAMAMVHGVEVADNMNESGSDRLVP